MSGWVIVAVVLAVIFVIALIALAIRNQPIAAEPPAVAERPPDALLATPIDIGARTPDAPVVAVAVTPAPLPVPATADTVRVKPSGGFIVVSVLDRDVTLTKTDARQLAAQLTKVATR